jgi:Fe2+ or Zn2+ uptake regulation protein
MNINIISGTESFRKECVKRHLRITPKRTVLYKELLKAEDYPNPNCLNSKKAAYSLT